MAHWGDFPQLTLCFILNVLHMVRKWNPHSTHIRLYAQLPFFLQVKVWVQPSLSQTVCLSLPHVWELQKWACQRAVDEPLHEKATFFKKIFFLYLLFSLILHINPQCLLSPLSPTSVPFSPPHTQVSDAFQEESSKSVKSFGVATKPLLLPLG